MVAFARRYIAEVTEKRGKRPSVALINDIQSNGLQFMKYWVRDGVAEHNPFKGVDLKDLGASEVVKSYQPFEKDELKKLFALPMPAEDKLIFRY